MNKDCDYCVNVATDACKTCDGNGSNFSDVNEIIKDRLDYMRLCTNTGEDDG